MRSNSDPLTVDEVKLFVEAVPAWYRDLYDVWFRRSLEPLRLFTTDASWRKHGPTPSSDTARTRWHAGRRRIRGGSPMPTA